MKVDRPIAIAIIVFIIILLMYFFVVPKYYEFRDTQVQLGKAEAEYNGKFAYYSEISKIFRELEDRKETLDKVVNAGFVDVFRHFYPTKKDAYTYWDMKTFARKRNIGWRIDYFFVSPSLISKIKSTKILTDYYGSDHCPIEIEL